MRVHAMKVNQDLSPGQVTAILIGSCLFIVACWVMVALAVAAVA